MTRQKSKLDRGHFTQLIDYMEYDMENGALNYYYDIRDAIIPYLHLAKLSDLLYIKQLDYKDYKVYLKSLDSRKTYDLLIYLILISYYSLKYVNYYLPKTDDPSLHAVLNVCFSPEMVLDLEYSDPELDVLADIFNNLTSSGRKNLQCYDCGTTARGVFSNLIRVNRGRFWLDGEEIQKFRKKYYEDSPDRFTSLKKLTQDLRTIKKSGVFIVGVRFGENLFGHIFIAEVLIDKESNRKVRFYQSALNSYLLIDYLAKMGYLKDENASINVDMFEKDMLATMKVNSWSDKEDALFTKWFAFWPQDKIKDTSPMRFHYAYITY